jgi:hypothetical protein
MDLTKVRFLIVLMIGACLHSVHAKDIYVATTGNDSGAGNSSAAPLKTIAAASARAAAGDNVYLMSGQYQEAIIPVASGTASAPITYKSYGSGPAVITKVPVGILVSSQAYLAFDGINVNGGATAPNASVGTFVVIQNSHNIVIRNGSFQYANGWAGIDVSVNYSPDGRYYATLAKGASLVGATSQITIANNTLDNVGIWANAYGDVIQVGAGTQSVLIQGNTLTHGGHDLVELDSDYGVMQANTMNNSYADIVGGDTGYRSVEVQGSYNVVQGNFMAHARQGGQGRVPPLASVRGQQNIFRQNILYDGIGEGEVTWCSDVQNPVTNTRIYNNTMYRLNSDALSVWAYTGCTSMSSIAFVNNLVVDSRLAPGTLSWAQHGATIPDTDLYFAVSGGAGVVNLGLGPTAGSIVKGNLFAPSGGQPAYVILAAAGGSIPLTAAASTYPQLFSGNVQARPVFANPQPSVASDFRLQAGSAGLGSGSFLTNVVGSGTSTRLTVADSLYFSDGNGLVPGDTIQLQGAAQTVQIQSIDRGANALILSSPIAYKDGQGVALPYNATAPDIGALSGGSAAVTPAPPGKLSIGH